MALEARVRQAEKGLSSLRVKGARASQLPPEPIILREPAEGPGPPRRWILSDSGKLHREASVADAALPFLLRRAGCGWAFGKSTTYRFVSDDEALELGDNTCARGCDFE